MAQRSSEAEGAFGDIKKNFGYSLASQAGRKRSASRVGAGDPGVQFEALSSTKNKVDEVKNKLSTKDRKGKKKQTEKQP